jgi:hypothetical protein
MKEYLDSLPPDEIVCFIDAYDVILLRPLEDLEAFFVNFNKITGARIVVGCDVNATGSIGLVSRLYYGACNNKYVNSGTYIGFASDLRDMMTFIFKEISDDVQADDQIMIRKYCSATQSVHIDCDRVFFLTLVGGKNIHFPLKHPNVNIVIDPDSHEMRFNNIKPFLVHGAGNINMLNLVEALGYDISLEQRVTILQETDAWLQKRTKQGIFQYGRMINVAIVAIILFILLVAIMIALKH